VARILQAEGRGKTIVFTRTKRSAQRVADDLAERGFPSSPLHGDMAQVAREKAMARFRDGTIDILVATDVAARGIDVSAVTHVINYTCPEDDKNYLHRIGRTGRAGASGIAITFVDWPDLARWKMINSTLGLPFEEPQETYSTSEHLYHDLGIPSDATGRIVPLTSMSGSLTPGQPNGRSGAPSRSRSGSASRSDRPDRSEAEGSRRRPPGDRQRRRTRSGQPVDTSASAGRPSGGDHAVAAGSDAAPAETGSASTSTGEPRPRRRRRRRTASGSPGAAASSGVAGEPGGADASLPATAVTGVPAASTVD
jgi:superfamily II DNA/RNA helicase